MLKRLSAFFIAFIIIFTFASCKDKEPSHKTGWNNPEEPSEKESTTLEEETTLPELTTSAAAEEVKINFSSDKALRVGSFNSEIYGKLTIYLQDGYFLIFDEYQDRKFTIFAEGYSPSKTDNKAQTIFEDMNFDGYTDFGVCYYKDALNSYYFCFIWNNAERTFRYQLSLSNLANPDFDPVSNTVIAYDRLTTTTATEKTYVYHQGVLNQISAKSVTEEPVTDGAETVDAQIQVMANGKNSTVILNSNENSHSKWVCTVENTETVRLASEFYNEEASVYEFMFSAVSEGATTVVFRYKSVITGEYIEEIAVNAIADEQMNVTIVVPQ